jgi:predicted nucleic acid-binding protein
MTTTPIRYTLDASVVMKAFNPAEAGHAISLQLQTAIQSQAVQVIVPTLLLTEVAATIGRVLGDTPAARSFVVRLSQLPYIRFASLTRPLALTAANLAAEYRLRGADAVYVAVVRQFGTTLVSLDEQQRTRTRAATSITVRTPAEALAELASPTP